MAAKKRAVNRPIMGTCWSVISIFLNEITQKIIVIMNAGTITYNVRNPSGMCILFFTSPVGCR